MSIDTDQLRSLPPAEKFRIIEMLWDDLENAAEPLQLPERIENEASRRTKELDENPSIGLDYDEVWRRIGR